MTRGRVIWLGGLALALLFLAADSAVRYRSIEPLQDAFSGAPQVDPTSPTGYAHEQRALILPGTGVDGLHWVMQTQQMLAGGGARIRAVTYDNAPDGREVHWSSSFRWWLAGVAAIHHAITGTPLPISVERVAPYANTLLFVILLIVLTPIVARRMGALAAGTLALAMVATKPFLIAFAVGDPDHHGIAVAAVMCALLFLIAGGAGWVRTDSPHAPSMTSGDTAVAAWLPTYGRARPWFIASGVAGGAGLWISAATATPALIGIAAGAVLACGVLARGLTKGDPWRAAPDLWRVWGFAGAASSFGFFLLEYFPSRMALRLEVNHPLYALAWLGGANLITVICRRLAGMRSVRTPGARLLVALSLIAVTILPTTIVAASARGFWVSDRFLWMLHRDYIREFGAFLPQLAGRSPGSLLADVSLLPLVVTALCALLWRPMPRPARALLALGLPAGAVAVLLAFVQTRWWLMADALWLAMLAAVVAMWSLAGESGRHRRMVLGVVALAVLPFPAFSLRDWIRDGWRQELNVGDLHTLITRSVAQSIRSRLGDSTGVVLTDPDATTLLVYYGAVRGIGTLYWENLPGLKTTVDILGAPTAERAHELIRAHGITHMVVFSWSFFAQESARLARGLRKSEPQPEDTFLIRIFKDGDVPPWLRMHQYKLPEDERLAGEQVVIFEVVPDSGR